MSELGTNFRNHVLQTSLPGCEVTQVDEDHITLTTSHAVGAVTFYNLGTEYPEIVELSIVDPENPDEPRFFLHFELDDEKRAEELFDEMCEQLQQQNRFGTTHVLLCCTAGLTTTMFANRLQEAAKTLSLDYSFEAEPLAQAKAEGGDYDAVLLAPQVGYQRKEVMASFPDAVVVQIPAKVFAAYDTGACLKMVMHLLSDNTVFSTGKGAPRLVRDLKNDERILVITCIKRPENTWYGWRIYDHGKVEAHGSVSKLDPSWRDIEDILATMPMRGIDVSKLDAVGVAVPGVVNRGSIAFSGEGGYGDYELGRILAERYGAKVFVDNNANAAAVGCYVSQDVYDSVVLHTQPTGHPMGGQGIVVDGHLVKGRINYAGEVGALYHAFYGADTPLDADAAWTPEGMRDIVARTLVADISLVAPDAIYVAVDLLDDMDVLRTEIARYFGDRSGFIPDIYRVEDYRELVALGEFALCLQKLHSPRPHRKH